jgi:alpha-L-arabinofuranosidase
MASYAPMLAKKGFTQWKTDMIFFDNTNICLTPNYHVQKMFMTNQGDYYFDNIVSKDTNDRSLAASCVLDSKTGDVILKLVNAGKESKILKVDLSSFKNIQPKAQITVLAGEANDENTFTEPNKIEPKQAEYIAKSKFDYNAPAMSLTVIRIKTKK